MLSMTSMTSSYATLIEPKFPLVHLFNEEVKLVSFPKCTEWFLPSGPRLFISGVLHCCLGLNFMFICNICQGQDRDK